jgi:hypothetical protein
VEIQVLVEARELVAASRETRGEVEAHLSRLLRERIKLLVRLDETLRALGMSLLDEGLYTGDMHRDVLLRIDMCRTLLEERSHLARQVTRSRRTASKLARPQRPAVR